MGWDVGLYFQVDIDRGGVLSGFYTEYFDWGGGVLVTPRGVCVFVYPPMGVFCNMGGGGAVVQMGGGQAPPSGGGGVNKSLGTEGGGGGG